MNTEQLKKLQKDYCERAKHFKKNAKENARQLRYSEAAKDKTRGEIYAICARDVNSLLSGEVLYPYISAKGKKLADKFLKTFNKK